jgi:hypothetical protein
MYCQFLYSSISLTTIHGADPFDLAFVFEQVRVFDFFDVAVRISTIESKLPISRIGKLLNDDSPQP